ncbi:hypothetical protein AMTR_s00006p00259720 [Amborella trichopoda]|uniref:Aminotransferase-like plant mobile domain-containing protein n=1 Tax=Amborella trichopoda TaxID=13333 RepID=W1PDX1_AMBTC|nr:hypothetical protein AMTR_s00006p00259720 [Amborella trichopoda]
MEDIQEILMTLVCCNFIQNIAHISYGKDRHTWLKVNFRELPPDATPIQVYRYTRAYLFFLIIVTIFADASVSTVPTRFLQFFEDIEGANTYAWGAAAIAFLYRSLGKFCTFKRIHFSGSATLMQCWSYEHIMHMRPKAHNDRQQAFQTTMCPTVLIFDDIAKSCMLDRVCRQFGAKQGILKNPLVVSKKARRQVGQRDWRNVNADKITNWLSRHVRIIPDIQQDTDNGLPLEEYKTWYNLFVPVDMGDVEAKMEHLQRQYNDEAAPDEAGDDGVGQSSRAVEDPAPSIQPAVEEPRRYNTRNKQYRPKRRRGV